MIPEFDKYAPYIWWSYGISFTVLILLLLWSLRRSTRVKQELDALEGQRRRAPATEAKTRSGTRSQAEQET